MKIIINTDGGARGNPGPAGIGAVIFDEQGKIISQHKQYIGEATNNVAEYKALILALLEVSKLTTYNLQLTTLEVRMDSELIVRQMQGKYKIKEPQLKTLATEAFKLLNNFKLTIFKHVPREDNKLADRLVNQALDEHFQLN